MFSVESDIDLLCCGILSLVCSVQTSSGVSSATISRLWDLLKMQIESPEHTAAGETNPSGSCSVHPVCVFQNSLVNLGFVKLQVTCDF